MLRADLHERARSREQRAVDARLLHLRVPLAYGKQALYRALPWSWHEGDVLVHGKAEGLITGLASIHRGDGPPRTQMRTDVLDAKHDPGVIGCTSSGTGREVEQALVEACGLPGKAEGDVRIQSPVKDVAAAIAVDGGDIV